MLGRVAVAVQLSKILFTIIGKNGMEAHLPEDAAFLHAARRSNRNNLSEVPSISLVLPAYNEQEVIVQAIDESEAALSALTDDYEILVVDDGSDDATASLVEELARNSDHVILLRQPRNLGYGAALRRGFEAATKQLVGFTDADCQFDLTELDRLVLLTRDYDIVCGYRIDRQDTFRRCFYSNVYNTIVRIFLGTGVRDCDCALKLFHRKVLVKLPISTNGYLVNAEMLTQARQQNMSIVEVGVTHRPRSAGVSKVSVMHSLPVLAALIRFWWNSVMFPCSAQQQSVHELHWPRRKQIGMALLLTLLSCVILFTNLSYSLIEPDEARYSQIGLEMAESGDWVVPTLDGEPYLDKPPLLYWLTASSFKLFGTSEQSARLPVALAALLTVLACYLLGRRLIGDWAAWAGALLLLFCSGFIFGGRFLMMDGVLALFTTIGLLSAAVALHTRFNSLVWWAVVGIACGLGILTKGPVALVICLPPVLAIAWLTQNRQVLQWRTWIAILAPTLLIACPWFWMIHSSQQMFNEQFFWVHHIVRYFNTFIHRQPWWFYAPVVAVAMFPATMLIPAMSVYLFHRGKKQSEFRTRELGFLLASGIWVVAFFSSSSCKLPAYILPAFPLFCLGFGKLLHDAQFATSSLAQVQRYSHRAVWYAFSIVAGVAVTAIVADLVMGTPGSFGMFIAAAFIFVPIISITLAVRSKRQARNIPWPAMVSLCLVVIIYGFGRVVPEIICWRSISRSAATVQQQLGDEVPVVYFGRQRYGASFSIKHSEVVEFNAKQAKDFAQYMAQHPIAVVVANRNEAGQIRKSYGDKIDLRGPSLRGKIYVAKTASSQERIALRPSRKRTYSK